MQPTYLVLFSQKQSHLLTDALLQAHVVYLQQLRKDNVLPVCGPFADNDGAMWLLKAESMAQAKQKVAGDPFVQQAYYQQQTIHALLEANDENDWLMTHDQTNNNLKKLGSVEKIFCYGTLQYEAVQLATFGRVLTGHSAVLAGYKRTSLMITNPDVVAASGEAEHPVLVHTGNPKDEVAGQVLYLSEAELAQSDQYESADYQRIAVHTQQGERVWLYVAKEVN